MRGVAAVRGRHNQPARLDHLPAWLDVETECLLNGQAPVRDRGNQPHLSYQRRAAPGADLDREWVVLVAFEPGRKIVRRGPTMSDHLFVAESVDRVPFAWRLGDSDADSAGIGRLE